MSEAREEVPPGLIDTNVFLHAQTTDALSGKCRRFLAALEQGRVRARLDPLVLHELSYALRHYLRHLTRDQVAQYLQTVLTWRGIEGEKALLSDAVERWRTTAALSFVDAYLGALAGRDGCTVYSKNVRDFAAQGLTVPNPLPAA